MLRYLALFVPAFMLTICTQAQKISCSFNDVSLSEALQQIGEQETGYAIYFLYNELEDFRITVSIKKKSLPEAIRLMIGYYPISVNVDKEERKIFVECIQKNEARYKGTVVDELGNPLSYANISLLSSKDSALLAGGVSNESGFFVIPCEYTPVIVRCSFIGYNTVYIPCDNTDIGLIQLRPETTILNSIDVRGKNPQYQMGEDGVITNVAHTPLSQLGTAHDVLCHVPGIIQKDNEYSVLGKGSPLIYINGRQMRNNKELDQLKSTDIKHIELVMNPGAKYDASVNAVIKIQTLRKAGDGFSIDAWGRWRQSHLSKEALSLDLNYRHQALDVFGSLWASHGKFLQLADMEQQNQGDSLWYQKNKMKTESIEQDYSIEGGFNYSANERLAFGAKYELGLPTTNDLSTELISNVEKRHQHYDLWYNNTDEQAKGNISHKLNTYYMGRIKQLGIDLNVDYLNNGYTKHSNIKETCEKEADRQINADNIVSNRMFASKLTLTHPLIGGTIDFGAEYINTRRQDDYINLAPAAEQHIPSSYCTLKEQSVSPYVEFARDIHLGRLRAGLRYEYVWFKCNNWRIRNSEQSRSYGNFFPSLTFDTKLGDIRMQLSYTVKTTRPTYRQLSNGVFYGNRYSISTGNPQLNKSTRHTAMVQATWKWVQCSVSYTDEQDAILHWIQELHTKSIETVVTYRNIPSVKSLTPMIVLSPTFNIWHPTLTVGLIKPWLTIESLSEIFHLNKPIVTIQLNNTFSFRHNLTAELNFHYQSQGHYQNVYMSYQQTVLDVSLIKTFFHDRLSIKLAGEDLLSRNRDGNHVYNSQVRLYQGNYYDRRRFALTIRYHFNTSRSKYKGTGAGNEEKIRL